MERHLLYQYVITTIYREQKLLGMLNPLAPPFYPPTEKEMDKLTLNEDTNKDKNSKDTTNEGLQGSNKNNIVKEAENKKTFTSEIQCTKTEQSKPMNTEWIQVQHGTRNVNIIQKESKETIQHKENNQYGMLREEEEEEEDSRCTDTIQVQSEVVDQQKERRAEH